MMEGSGEIQTRVDQSTGSHSVLSPGFNTEQRAATMRFLAEMMLSEEEEEDEENICSNILSAFINNLQDRQWESIRERMREPVTCYI